MAIIASCGSGVKKYDAADDFYQYMIAADKIDDSGLHAKSLHFIDSVLRSRQNPEILDSFYYYSTFYNVYTKSLHDRKIALQYADSMTGLFEKNKNALSRYTDKYVEALFCKGDALMALNEYHEAFNLYYKAKTLANKTADSCSLSSYSYRLAMVLYKQERFRPAISYFREASKEAKSCRQDFSNFYFRQELMDNVGLCYARLHVYDSALRAYKKNLAYVAEHYMQYSLKRTDNVYNAATGVVYGNMADVYDSLNMLDTAAYYYKKSIEQNLAAKYDMADARHTRIKLAALYLKEKNIPGLTAQLSLIKTELDSFPNDVDRLGWYSLKWQYYNSGGKTTDAFDYLQKYVKLKDSLNEQNNKLLQNDMDIYNNHLDQQLQLDKLKKSDDSARLYLLIDGIVTVMGICILLLIFSNLKGARKNVKTLTRLNTHVKDQRARLQETMAELEERDKDKSRILRTVAHDVMNPIAAISALTDLLLAEPDNYTDEQKEMLALIKEACSNSLALSHDILEAAATLAPGKMEKEPTDINAIVKNCVELLHFRALSKKQTVTVNTDAGEQVIIANKEKVWRSLNNLIINAIKFSPEGATIDVQAHKEDGNIHITVKDEGIGIPDKIKDKVFDMFTDAKRTGTSGEKPFGLGLAISRQIVEAHGGTIWFDSKPDKGTTFHILLPVNDPEVAQQVPRPS